MEDSHTPATGATTGKTKTERRPTRLRRRLIEWSIHQHLMRGLAYGVGSGAVSLLILWIQNRH
ncbi:hypothetical protein [Streptomyces sp. NPDC006610]|uniref:hypothetical protein n=1 Tax=Streptomyces sp. NPDC006610 TaxID=3154584 RepID=UPI0033A41E23